MINLNNLGPEWYSHLNQVFQDPRMIQLGNYILSKQDVITPPVHLIFKAFELVQPSQLKVLIIGQDPYPTPGVANGLAFSYQGASVPQSLRIIFKELKRDGFGDRQTADLTDWASQGVMLLNTVLTTEHGIPFHHKKLGWDILISRTLQVIHALDHPFVVMAWGAPAKETLKRYIGPKPNRLMLESCHPIAENYSGGKIKFTGCGHFSKCNEFLVENGLSPINWT